MSPESLTLGSAFLVGLFGGPHCASMCGGISATLTMGLDPQVRTSLWRQLPYLLGYNLGRIASYAAAGALVGALGLMLAQTAPVAAGQTALQALAGLIMLALGLYVGGWWPSFSRVESLGMPVWRRLEPLGQRLLPVRSVGGSVGLGLVWGWLPCGMVYMVLVQALSSGGALSGAALMAAFGLGTLPNLLVVGAFAGAVSRWLGNPWVRRAAGAVLVLFAAMTLWTAFAGGGPGGMHAGMAG